MMSASREWARRGRSSSGVATQAERGHSCPNWRAPLPIHSALRARRPDPVSATWAITRDRPRLFPLRPESTGRKNGSVAFAPAGRSGREPRPEAVSPLNLAGPHGREPFYFLTIIGLSPRAAAGTASSDGWRDRRTPDGVTRRTTTGASVPSRRGSGHGPQRAIRGCRRSMAGKRRVPRCFPRLPSGSPLTPRAIRGCRRIDGRKTTGQRGAFHGGREARRGRV
jgi:hypothetical protein